MIYVNFKITYLMTKFFFNFQTQYFSEKKIVAHDALLQGTFVKSDLLDYKIFSISKTWHKTLLVYKRIIFVIFVYIAI